MFDLNETRFKVQVFLPTLDLLSNSIKSLGKRMEEMNYLFSPVVASLPKKDCEEEYFVKSAEGLHNAYPKDLDKSDLSQELRMFYKITQDGLVETDENVNSAVEILNKINKKGLQNVFPQICVVLRLMEVLPVSVASEERAFSKMALIKNILRSIMGEDHLNHLLILSIELVSIDFKDVINDFARVKSRKVLL